MGPDKVSVKLKAAQLFTENLAKAVQSETALDYAVAEKGNLTAPAVSLYKRIKVGTFTGRLSITWDGPDLFIFEPVQGDLFTYFTYVTPLPGGNPRPIQPGRMVTDGGSIPYILRAEKKYSSWYCAPAFIIHDWLFTAHYCKYRPDYFWGFNDSAEVMAEAIKTLMEVGYTRPNGKVYKLPKDVDLVYVMYTAVKTFIAQSAWDNGTPACIR